MNQGVQSARGQIRARVLVHAPAAVVGERVPPAFGSFAVVDDHTCVFETTASSIESLAVYVSLLDADFEIEDPPELVAYIRTLARRYAKATPTAGAETGTEPKTEPEPAPAPGE